MNATNAMFHLDAAACSVPEPTFPPDALNSDISDILRATRPFLDTDRDWIIPNIEDLRRQVSVYDNLLNRIDEIRSMVQSRHDAVQKAMVVYSSTLAPVRRLPVDVLRIVFRKIQVSEWRTPSLLPLSHTPIFSQGPWTLSHICGAWRDVALSYPQLWSHIILRCRDPGSLKIHPFARSPPLVALKAMILHSEQCPLDIAFQIDLYHDMDITEKVFAMILEVSHRWRTLELRMSSNFLERLKVVRGRIPCLKSLTLDSGEALRADRAELADDIRSLFTDAPCIRNITLPLHGIYDLGDFVFPLHITHLAAPVKNVANLGVYQSLVECHLEIRYGPSNTSDISLPPHIFLPNVRRLFVISFQILAHLCLPSLNHLTIAALETHIPQYTQVANDFLRRSQCSLTRLAFYSTDGDDQSLIEDSLVFMETVVCLEVDLLGDDNDIFNALTSDKFLPNLQHLRLFGSIAPSSQDLLTAIISSHRRHLRSVKISCSADEMESINQQLSQIQQPGQHFIAVQRQVCDTGSWQFGNFNLSNLDDAVDQ
ncbi:hypothetical protein IW261DRAFT_1516363 [Armillaria novae-zelandiae]|uniref:F-box domain-containing protein n=1 Tax=Armillaria novae-zelandiae TaxID=153914 RepID=A0AA39NRH4_9AGAR|nr:hypothetical protein IW261DRAFT_1516363 [Armillaria novae-zelandiae]